MFRLSWACHSCSLSSVCSPLSVQGSPSLPDKTKSSRELLMLLPPHRERPNSANYYNAAENAQVRLTPELPSHSLNSGQYSQLACFGQNSYCRCEWVFVDISTISFHPALSSLVEGLRVFANVQRTQSTQKTANVYKFQHVFRHCWEYASTEAQLKLNQSKL